jgi:Zn-dependent M28 family amino/carboxypeptidase
MHLLPRNRREGLKSLLNVGVVMGLMSLLFGCMTSMPGRSHEGPLPALSGEEAQVRDNLKRHVTMLATTIGERNMRQYYAELERAAEYITGAFHELGYTTKDYAYPLEGKSPRNIEAIWPGSDPTAGTIVVGGHYDSVLGTPGANDNASGVAATLELARLFKAAGTPRRTLRFVAFVNEEPPYFLTADMGSRVYARRLRQDKVNVTAMFSLETIGFYSDAQGSQHYPPVFSMLYPNTGNFIAFIGNMGSRGLVRHSVKVFRETTAFPSEGAALPAWVPGVNWSDHSSFWMEKYPGLMVTDTAPFRYRHYHTEADTPDKIDWDRTARVVMGVYRVVSEAAGASQ